MSIPVATLDRDAGESPASGWIETAVTVMWILLAILTLFVCSGAVALLWL
jgi:hypothetical protein